MRIFNITKRRAAVVLAVLFAVLSGQFPVGAGAAPAPVIIYPPDRALLAGDGSVELHGFLPGGRPGWVTISGTSGSRAQPVGIGSFTVKIQLDPGESTLVLLETKVTVFLPGGAAATIPPGFSPPDSHALDNGCEECHTFSDAAAALLEAPPALCSRCHDDVLSGQDGKPQAVLHPPAEEGDCLACHAFHRLSIKRLPAAAKRALCFGCHDDFTDGGKKRMHVPVAQGECTGCHGAHAAAGKNLLPVTGKELCVKCHDDPTRAPDGKEWAVTHPALDDGCPSCHQPHVAPAAGLLKQDLVKLCYECHDAFAPPAKDTGGSIHLPVAQGECALCHAPHGSAVKKLLVASPAGTLCLKCHKNPALNPAGVAWAVPHAALDDGCPSCHQPHVAAAARLLPKPQGELCAGCHEDKNRNSEGEEWSTRHPPVAKGLCASCHGPHGGREKALLRQPVNEICRTCHSRVHASHLGTEIDPDTEQPIKKSVMLPPGFPVRKSDGLFSCEGCHSPHGSEFPQLWSKDELSFCAECHQQY